MNLEKVWSKSTTHPVGLPGHMQKSALNMQNLPEILGYKQRNTWCFIILTGCVLFMQLLSAETRWSCTRWLSCTGQGRVRWRDCVPPTNSTHSATSNAQGQSHRSRLHLVWLVTHGVAGDSWCGWWLVVWLVTHGVTHHHSGVVVVVCFVCVVCRRRGLSFVSFSFSYSSHFTAI